MPPSIAARSRWRQWRPRAALAVVAVLAAVLMLVPSAQGTPGVPSVARPAAGVEPVVLVLFWLEGCPHCAAEKRFLQGLADRHPRLVVDSYELHDASSQERFRAAGEALGFEPQSVPVTVLGDRYWIGFDDTTARQIEAAVGAAEAGEATSPEGKPAADEPGGNTIDVPLLGDVDVGTQPLLLATVLIAFVDGVNPCSLWVLSILLGLVLHTGSRRRVLAVGLTFLAVTSALYGLYIAGIYSLLAYAAYITWIQRGVAVLAAGFGAVNIKDYFWYRRGPSLTIADKHKPGLYRHARAIAQPERRLLPLLGATAAMAVGVSLIETPCTLGFPVIWTNLLSAHDVGIVTAAALFTLYMVVFLLDEVAIFAAAVLTMRAIKLQERQGRLLKLAGGTVMLALAATMAVRPETLTTVTGTATVFAAAGGVIAAVLVTEHLVELQGQRRNLPSGGDQSAGRA